jgi:hypothetical protein
MLKRRTTFAREMV